MQFIFPETIDFQGKVILRMLKLFPEGNRTPNRQGVQIPPEKTGKLNGCFFSLGGLVMALHPPWHISKEGQAAHSALDSFICRMENAASLK